ncbi:restriction endonuclease subunit S [Campylobacter jejuni]
MNKIEKLLNELCPNGVEFKSLGEVCEYIRGVTYAKNQEIQDLDDGIKILRANNITLNNVLDLRDLKVIHKNVKIKNTQFLKRQDILICAGSGSKEHIGKIAFIDRDMDFAFGGFMGVIRSKKINSRFLFFYLSSEYFRVFLKKELESSTINNLNSALINKFQIPIPPIEIQEEIVKILDAFTDLEADLEAELEARRRQYEYYRNKLLSFEYLKTNGGGYELKMLGEVCEISTGGSNSVDEEINGIYPFYTRSQEIKRINRYEFDETAIITSGDGVGVGKIIHFIQGKYALHQRAYRIHILQDSINPKFVYFYMKAYFYDYIMKTAVSSSVSSLRMKMLTGFQIPIPPLAIQEKIVSILDQFHALTTDLTSGIPAEIEARKKQYEYYRNQLLTFKEAI